MQQDNCNGTPANRQRPNMGEPVNQLQSGEGGDAWALLWSQSQNALHVEPLSRMLQANRSAYAHNRHMDYVPLYVGEKALAETIANSVRNTIRQREDQRVDRVPV